MNTNASKPLLQLALVPLTAAILGCMIVALFYFLQPTTSSQTSRGTFQEPVGLVHLEVRNAPQSSTYHIL